MPEYTNHPQYPSGFAGTDYDSSIIPDQVHVSLEQFSVGPFIFSIESMNDRIEAVYDIEQGHVIGYREYHEGAWRRYMMPVCLVDVIEVWFATSDGLRAVQQAIQEAIEERMS
jgi:hypothetical protein